MCPPTAKINYATEQIPNACLLMFNSLLFSTINDFKSTLNVDVIVFSFDEPNVFIVELLPPII